MTVCPLKLTTRLPFCGAGVVVRGVESRQRRARRLDRRSRSADPPLVALTGSLIVSLPSARPNDVGVVAEAAVERVVAGPPTRTSLPPRPFSVSLPPKPRIRSLPAVPVSVSPAAVPTMRPRVPSANCSRSMFRSLSVPSSASSIAWVTWTVPVGVAGERIFRLHTLILRRIDIGDRIGARRGDLTHDLQLARIDFTREHLCSKRRHAGVIFQDGAGAAVSADIWCTAMRTFSHLSPSMMSSPPRPMIMSLPSPPRMISPAE